MPQTILLPINSMGPTAGLGAEGDSTSYRYGGDHRESRGDGRDVVGGNIARNEGLLNPQTPLQQQSAAARGADPPTGSSSSTTTANNPTYSTGSQFGRDLATTPFAFASLGQTPMTGASLGMAGGKGGDPTPPRTAGILKASNYPVGNNNDNATTSGMQGLTAAAGLIRGNDPLGPTPLVRRKDLPERTKQSLPTPSPGMHYHTTMMQSVGKTGEEGADATATATTQKRVQFPGKDDEDPSMLRYESRPGSDQSPMIRTGGDGKPVVEGGGGGNEETRLVEYSDANTAAAAGRSSTSVPVLSEFPFYFDGYASWVCRHCNHVSPYYRGANYIWHFPQAPPNEFVDHHLRFCPGLNPNAAHTMTPIQQQQQPPALPSTGSFPPAQQQPSQSSGGGYPYQMQQQHPSMHQGGAPDPPTGRSPIPPSSRSTKHSDPLFAYAQPYQQQYPYQQYHGAQYIHEMPPLPSTHQDLAQMGFGAPQDASPAVSTASKSKRRVGKNISPKGISSDDPTYARSVEQLNMAMTRLPTLTQPGSDIGSILVEEADSDLLTDYFFQIMKQLVVCRFAETDRKTRGGKRENINIGYGGLQCRHCIEQTTSRKFFWSNVDRLANSFAEIPTHVLKCKHTPANIKEALLVLKGRHPSQMQSLPRGSQKVFFRRMWRRLHDGDEAAATPVRDAAPATASVKRESSVKASATDSSLSNPDLASDAAARMLAASLDAESPREQVTETKGRILLSVPEDKEWLSDVDCFVRNNIEVFSATTMDVADAAADRKYPIKVGQVGIRCVHCAMCACGARGPAVAYPYSISGIYESVREFQRMHFDKCENLPEDVREKSEKVSKGATSLSSVLRRYYVQSARALGLYDTKEGGIRAGAEVEPVSRASFHSTSTAGLAPSDNMIEMGRKRKASPTDFDMEHDSKRPHSNEEGV